MISYLYMHEIKARDRSHVSDAPLDVCSSKLGPGTIRTVNSVREQSTALWYCLGAYIAKNSTTNATEWRYTDSNKSYMQPQNYCTSAVNDSDVIQ